MRSALLLLAVVVFAVPSLADDKKKPDKGNFDDLFGAPPPKSNMDAMKKATEGMKTKGGTDGLAAKVETVEKDAGVQLLNVFAAQTISQDKKLGCQPGGRDKKKVMQWTFNEVPAKGVPFEVCLTMASKAGREMNMSVSIVDSRNQRVVRAEDVIDFRGRPKMDHVLAYPTPVFKLPGQYFYVVDLEGKEAGRLPIFVVNVTSDSSGAPSAPSATTDDGPATAKEPDGT